jgi:DTW domain-containing protein
LVILSFANHDLCKAYLIGTQAFMESCYIWRLEVNLFYYKLSLRVLNHILNMSPCVLKKGWLMTLQRKRKTKDPCLVCYLHKERCICAQIPLLDLRTRVCFVIHAKELKRTTNTGRLAHRALKNSEMRVRGEEREALDLSDLLDPTYQPLLLFPSEEARELNDDFMAQIKKPILLIVPDGNWRQASKVHHRHQELASVQRVCLKKKLQQQNLRAESSADGMATLEAVAEALRWIEGEFVGDSLRQLYTLKLTQTLLGRGTLTL